MSRMPTPPPLTDSEYHALARAVLAAIEATVDRWLQDDVIDIDSAAHRRPAGAELPERQQDRRQHAAAAARAVAGRARGRLPLQLGRRPLDRPRRAASSSRCCRAAPASRPGRRWSSRRPDRSIAASSALEQVEDALALVLARRLAAARLPGRRWSRRRRWRTPRTSSRRRADVTPSGGGSSCTGTPLQRVLHVVDPHRQRQAAAGLAVAQLARLCRSRSRPPPPGSGW